jgi:hypothetical protein
MKQVFHPFASHHRWIQNLNHVRVEQLFLCHLARSLLLAFARNSMSWKIYFRSKSFTNFFLSHRNAAIHGCQIGFPLIALATFDGRTQEQSWS